MAGETDLKRKQVTFLYNPALLSREELRDLFVARHAERDQILAHLRAAGSSPQHSLLIGDRGMGKTTLLLRLAHSLEEDQDLCERWLPVRLDEEQYNLGGLGDLWLNCLEKIGEDIGDPTPGRDAERLKQEYEGATLEEAAFLRLREHSLQKGRRLLLLIDNFDILLERIDQNEMHRLREILQRESWLMLVGASAHDIPQTFDYKSPFYDFFHVIALEPLSFPETIDFLLKLGHCFHREAQTKSVLRDREEDLKILQVLVGGNLRTVTLLFSLLHDNPAAELPLLLNRLLDQYTSSFKDLIEVLPAQGQRVFDSLARFWDPVTAEGVAKELRIDRGVASAQLHRLVDRDLAVKVQLPQRSLGFQVRDRFFNLWYLMRSGRGQRRKLPVLLEFLDLFAHPAREDSGIEPIVLKLKKSGLVNEELLAAAEKEALRLQEKKKQSGELWDLDASVPTQVHLLALCSNGDLNQAKDEAIRFLSAQPGDPFVRIIASHLLAQGGEKQRALDLLTAAQGEGGLSAVLQLARARLLLDLGRAEEAGLLLMTHWQSADIPPTEIAAIAALIARSGDKKIGWLAQGLFNKAVERAPAHPAVLLAGCEIETALDHPKQALEHFQAALAAARRIEPVKQRRPLLSMALRLGADHPAEVLQSLKEVGLDEEWLPLTHALAYLSGESDRLDKLAPEMRKFTETVLASIQGADRLAPVSSK